jgi:hypothetical protein
MGVLAVDHVPNYAERRMLTLAPPGYPEAQTISERWIREVYRYNAKAWTRDGKLWDNIGDLVFGDLAAGQPLEYHAAVVWIRQFEPGHAPRLGLILDPGPLERTRPCIWCGLPVRYSRAFDAYVDNHVTGGVGNPCCPDGMTHIIDPMESDI